MLPKNIQDFVRELDRRTAAGEFKWNVYTQNDSVTLVDSRFEVSLLYRWNPDLEIGTFAIMYEVGDQNYVFRTDQESSDYRLVESLYHQAQASNIRLPF